MATRIVTATRDGTAIGIEFRHVPEMSILAELGFRSGDVLLEVNGLPIRSPDEGLYAYSALKSAKCFEVVFERDGTRMTKRYLVSDD